MCTHFCNMSNDRRRWLSKRSIRCRDGGRGRYPDGRAEKGPNTAVFEFVDIGARGECNNLETVRTVDDAGKIC